MRAAAVAWELRPIRSEEEFFDHLEEMVQRAADLGAGLIVLPELCCFELLPLKPELDLKDAARFLAEFEEPIEEALFKLAEETGAVIVGGSHLATEEHGITNLCLSAYPTDERFRIDGDDYSAGDYQRKINLTTWEREDFGLVGGAGLKPLMDPRIGVTICYDSEFPESGRALAEAGVQVHCIPAYTETRQGFQRVRWCAHARTVENQVFAIHASLVGTLRFPAESWSTFGSSAILCPSMPPFPESGILAETDLNREGVVVADLDFPMLEECRSTGDVRPWLDRANGDWSILSE